MKKLKQIKDWFFGIAIAATVIALIIVFFDYDMGRYKRKFPQATTFDYWMDRNR